MPRHRHTNDSSDTALLDSPEPAAPALTAPRKPPAVPKFPSHDVIVDVSITTPGVRTVRAVG
jgi:hypothetical protein